MGPNERASLRRAAARALELVSSDSVSESSVVTRRCGSLTAALRASTKRYRSALNVVKRKRMLSSASKEDGLHLALLPPRSAPSQRTSRIKGWLPFLAHSPQSKDLH